MPRRVACVLLSLLPACAAFAAETALSPIGNTLLHNSVAGSHQFGYGSATGDVDNDGVSDLIIAPNGTNSLRILRGNAWSVGTSAPVIKFLGTTFQPGVGVRSHTVITGDFDGDGRDEIAFGNPSYSASVPSGGRAYVARRDPGSGSWDVTTTIQQELNGYPGVHEASDSFGYALAAADFDADGYDDLAIGSHGEDVGTTDEAGAVMITYGTASGITSARSTLITRNSDGLSFTPMENDRYGFALTTGDFDADGYSDLAIGATGARCPDGTTQAGAVIVLYGSAGGLVTTRSRIFRPGVSGMQGACTSATNFGSDLAAGGFDAGITSDLAIGTNVNAVHVIYAGANGLETARNQRFTPADFPGVTAASRFGSRLAAGRLRRVSAGLILGRNSLVIGAPSDAPQGLPDAGSVLILHAEADGLTTSGAERWIRSAARSVGAPATEDRYGSSLTIGDYNDDGVQDLAIGVPYYDDGATADDGAVEVLYGSGFIFRDGFQ